MKAKRFFYVSSHRCRTVHIQYGRHHSEGLTACGRKIVPHVWWWWKWNSRPRVKPVCSQCEDTK